MKKKSGFDTNCHPLSSPRDTTHPPPHSIHWKIHPQHPQQPTKSRRFPCCHPRLCPPRAQVTCPKESWQNYSEANKDTCGLPRQLALASAFITSHFCETQKPLMEPPSRAYDGLHGAVTPAFGAHGFHGWDSQRSVMNIHVWSAAGMILGEIERGRKMNIELTCWAG